MRLLIAWPLLLSLLAFPAPVLADIAPDPLAGLSEPRPLDAKAAQGISMKHEQVIIELHDAYALIDATFTMANPGPPRELQVGFPGRGVRLDIPDEYASHEPLEGFSVWVEGRAVPHEAREFERSSSYAGRTKTWSETWHVFTTRFAQGDTRRADTGRRPMTGAHTVAWHLHRSESQKSSRAWARVYSVWAGTKVPVFSTSQAGAPWGR